MLAGPPSLCLETLAMVLKTDPAIELSGEVATSGPMLLRAVSRVKPGVLVLDYELTDRQTPLLKKVSSKAPECKVVFLSGFPGPKRILRAQEAGARGFVLKSSPLALLIEVIRGVSAGKGPFFPGTPREIDGPALKDGAGPEEDWVRFNTFSARETQILMHLNKGHSIAQIAGLVELTPKTVRNRISQMLGKTRSRSQNELLARARACGFIA